MSFHSKYICQQCGYESTGWLGKCPECGTWNSLVETVVSTTSNKSNISKKSRTGIKTEPIKLSEVKSADTKRISTKISELDRVLGGGLVPGQVVLIAGEPGIGKSTLLTQISDTLGPVLYVCGEESASQVAIRAKRLEVSNKNIQLLEDTDVDSVVDQLNSNPQPLSAVIVDSIQTMTTSDLSGMAGSVGQVRESANRLLHAAKEKNIPLTTPATKEINAWKPREQQRKAEANISFDIRENNDDLSYLGMDTLAKVVDGSVNQSNTSSLVRDAIEYKPMRNAIGHTAQLTKIAQQRLSLVYENIKARIKTLLS